LEPLNDGLPELFWFRSPRFLGKVNVETLGFSATTHITDAAAGMADVEGRRERTSKTDETGFLTGDVCESRVLSAAVRIMDHIGHGALPGLKCNDGFEEGLTSREIRFSLPFARVC
jgi:hypothetical protein